MQLSARNVLKGMLAAKRNARMTLITLYLR